MQRMSRARIRMGAIRWATLHRCWHRCNCSHRVHSSSRPCLFYRRQHRWRTTSTVQPCFVGPHVRAGVSRDGSLEDSCVYTPELEEVCLCVQVVSDASESSASSATQPPLIAQLYRAVAALQFRGVLLSPACTGATPFESDYALFSIILGLWVIASGVYYCAHSLGTRRVGHIALLGAIVLYPSAALSAAQLLDCHTVVMSAQGAAGLDGGPLLQPSDISNSRTGSVPLRVGVLVQR